MTYSGSVTEGTPYSSGGYGSPADWSQILAAAGQGAGSAMQGAAQHANSKSEAREAKRRTLANLLNSAKKRNQSLFRQNQEHQDEMTDYKAQALQQVAQGFLQAFQ